MSSSTFSRPLLEHRGTATAETRETSTTQPQMPSQSETEMKVDLRERHCTPLLTRNTAVPSLVNARHTAYLHLSLSLLCLRYCQWIADEMSDEEVLVYSKSFPPNLKSSKKKHRKADVAEGDQRQRALAAVAAAAAVASKKRKVEEEDDEAEDEDEGTGEEKRKSSSAEEKEDETGAAEEEKTGRVKKTAEGDEYIDVSSHTPSSHSPYL